MVEPYLLWAGEHWPLTDDDHEFLVPAFTRIGRALHGDKWNNDFPALNPLRVEALRVEQASPGERAWCHRALSALYPADYEEDYELPPAPRLATLGQLGGVLGVAEDVGRAPGWWFSQFDWERFRAAIHYQNELRKPEIEMVNDAARWLFNQIIRGSLTPYVQNIQSGGGWRASSTDDWRMPNAERLRMRIQRCAMVPGNPAVPGGTHWIFINKAELDAALSGIEGIPGSVAHQPDNGAILGETPHSRQEMTTTQVATARAFARDALLADHSEGRDKLLAKARASLGFDISEYEWKRSIWPDGREDAGLPRKKRAGRPSQASAKSVEKTAD